MSLYADGVNVHAFLMPRTDFRRMVEGSVQNSFLHSLLAKGRLLYTHDERIADSVRAAARARRARPAVQLLRAATARSPADLQGAQVVRDARRSRLHGAVDSLCRDPLAQIEVIGAGLLADREVIPQAMTLNPAFFRTVYTDLLNSQEDADRVEAALDAVDHYIAERAATLFEPVLEHLRDVGEARSAARSRTISCGTTT